MLCAAVALVVVCAVGAVLALWVWGCGPLAVLRVRAFFVWQWWLCAAGLPAWWVWRPPWVLGVGLVSVFVVCVVAIRLHCCNTLLCFAPLRRVLRCVAPIHACCSGVCCTVLIRCVSLHALCARRCTSLRYSDVCCAWLFCNVPLSALCAWALCCFVLLWCVPRCAAPLCASVGSMYLGVALPCATLVRAVLRCSVVGLYRLCVLRRCAVLHCSSVCCVALFRYAPLSALAWCAAPCAVPRCSLVHLCRLHMPGRCVALRPPPPAALLLGEPPFPC